MWKAVTHVFFFRSLHHWRTRGWPGHFSGRRIAVGEDDFGEVSGLRSKKRQKSVRATRVVCAHAFGLRLNDNESIAGVRNPWAEPDYVLFFRSLHHWRTRWRDSGVGKR